jgi:DNA-binding response OmpR family regulator
MVEICYPDILYAQDRPFRDGADLTFYTDSSTQTNLFRSGDDLSMLFVPEQELCSLQSTLSVPLRIDLMQQRVWIAGEPLHVSRKEFIILHLLQQWQDRGEPCPRRLLCQMVYVDEVALPHDREARLDCLVARLRQKLKQIAGQPVEIKTIWGVGYQLRFYSESSS